MVFDEEFFSNVPSEFIDALKYFRDSFFSFDSSLRLQTDEIENYEDYINAYYAFEAFANVIAKSIL